MSQVNLIVTIEFTLKNKQKIIDAIVDMQEPSRKEAGCVRYDYATSNNELSRIFLVEVWKDRNAFEVHKETQHFIDGNIILAEYCNTITLHEVNWNIS